MARLAVFEEHRDRLWGIAYRLTGSVADADDAVQETWLRWQRQADDEVKDPRAFLTTVVSRICYDQFASARSRREVYVGPWLPEPLVTDAATPEDRVTLDESVGLAMLAVMERLTPAERTSFILHDVFAMPFPEIAGVVGRTPDAVRQLASRARQRIRAEAPRRTVDRAAHRAAVAAFLGAVGDGDLERLTAVLDPDVVWHSDGGGQVSAARVPVVGRDKVARFALGLRKYIDPTTTQLRPATVNGAPGVVVAQDDGTVVGVIALAVADGLIVQADVVVNPEKLRHLHGLGFADPASGGDPGGDTGADFGTEPGR
ncbi:RNA polymerase sigma factor SigJ [Actinacidiphila acididurans]|uniref:RNA polymerase sigma factor SigJ n=1 Tax=Actinacidiphila acididurans TaxID=2784346 RepID=A0ABS2TZE2_9ACTN|nr:RNA polymerase sigma factor SigJ [Actinacidiphila acididurans]MBM9508699.1 RNA polymerase sigma factor SigJ [Actinacidiphila acididurans]